jgi:hypothetical protein
MRGPNEQSYQRVPTVRIGWSASNCCSPPVREMYFGTREPFDYYNCSACAALQIVNVPEGEQLTRHYPQNYHAYNVSALSRLSDG